MGHKVFDLPLFLLIQRSEMSYQQVWEKGSRGARRASLLALLLAGGDFNFFFNLHLKSEGGLQSMRGLSFRLILR